MNKGAKSSIGQVGAFGLRKKNSITDNYLRVNYNDKVHQPVLDRHTKELRPRSLVGTSIQYKQGENVKKERIQKEIDEEKAF